jgi:hypothetical protein
MGQGWVMGVNFLTKKVETPKFTNHFTMEVHDDLWL